MGISVDNRDGASVDFLTSRREVRKSTLAPLLLLLLAACGKAPVPAVAPPAPREETPVIIYLIDTLRADRLGLYGYDKPTSPVIDALAQESVVFDHAYSTAPWTLPSIASMLTSRYPCEHGLHRTELKLAPSIPTLTEHLQGLGYATGAYYQNVYPGPVAGLNRAFQVSEYRAYENSHADDTRAFLQQVQTGPFFLYHHAMEVHDPYATPHDFIRPFGHVGIDRRTTDSSRRQTLRLLWFVDSNKQQPIGSTDATPDIRHLLDDITATRDTLEVLYDGAVRYADHRLGETIAVLRERGIWDRALFILMADHGEELHDHGLWFHDQSVYEELIHVPLLVHFPQGAHGGTRVGERVSLLDVMPTVLDYLGRPALCRDCRGSSLLPLVGAGNGAYRRIDTPSLRNNVWGYYKPLKESRGDVNVVVRDGPLKAIWNAEPGQVELYDLAADPGERNDLARERPTDAAALGQRAREWLDGCRAGAVEPVQVPRSEISETMREQLRAHGYFGGG